MGSHEPRRHAARALLLSGGHAPDHRRSGVLHGRRAGRPLRTDQRARYERGLPGLEIDVSGLAAPQALFAHAPADIRMEIGFGGGEHLAAEAERLPEVGFIGCEPFRNGVAKLIDHIDLRRLANIRIYAGDAGEALDALPEAALAQVDLLYPDPWPKRRQRKRRFVSAANLQRLARVMRPGAQLRFATDIDDYAGWTLSEVLRSPWFRWRADEAADWRTPWQPWSPTRYEAKAAREGRQPVYLTVVRCAPA